MIVCWLSMVVPIDFCKRGQGLADGLGSCWKSNADSQLGFCLTRNTNQPLFILCHILVTAKKEKWRHTLLFWTSLLPTTVFQDRSFGDTCKKSRVCSIWEVSFKPCTQDAYTSSLMATKCLRRLRPTEAWNSAALRVPFCTPFITMTWTDSWLYRDMLPLPWSLSRPIVGSDDSCDLVRWFFSWGYFA